MQKNVHTLLLYIKIIIWKIFIFSRYISFFLVSKLMKCSDTKYELSTVTIAKSLSNKICLSHINRARSLWEIKMMKFT